jgi:hypothetical protein
MPRKNVSEINIRSEARNVLHTPHAILSADLSFSIANPADTIAVAGVTDEGRRYMFTLLFTVPCYCHQMFFNWNDH